VSTVKLSISEAARAAGVSRQHFYTKYINPGLISIDRENPDKPTIDTAELLRVFPNMSLPDSLVSANSQELTQELSRKIMSLDSELTAARQQLAASQDREKWLQGTVDKLTDTIRLLEHRPDPQQDQGKPEKRGFWARLFKG
jgi:hypothetical protein